jgi:ketosteroid isomerase-like protein
MDRHRNNVSAMTNEDFAKLLDRFCDAASRGDGAAFAACFTEDGVYHDYIYGPHRGRASIADMLVNLFHRDATSYDWRMFDPVCRGDIGYAWSLSKFVSTIAEFKGKEVVIDGMSRFVLKDGLISDYRESVNGGVAMAQLGVEPQRIAKVMQRWAARLRDRPEVKAYMKR